jgi:hypothetical protein
MMFELVTYSQTYFFSQNNFKKIKNKLKISKEMTKSGLRFDAQLNTLNLQCCFKKFVSRG